MRNETQTLADLRRKVGLSQTQVADALGISQARVSRLEAQYPDVRFTALRDYLHAVGVKVVFDGWDIDRVDSTQVIADASRAEAMERRRKDPSRGGRFTDRHVGQHVVQTDVR